MDTFQKINVLIMSFCVTQCVISAEMSEELLAKAFNKVVEKKKPEMLGWFITREPDIAYRDDLDWSNAFKLLVNADDNVSIRTVYDRNPRLIDKHAETLFELARLNNKNKVRDFLLSKRSALVERSK
jgi:hypothetical protein